MQVDWNDRGMACDGLFRSIVAAETGHFTDLHAGGWGRQAYAS